MKIFFSESHLKPPSSECEHPAGLQHHSHLCLLSMSCHQNIPPFLYIMRM